MNYLLVYRNVSQYIKYQLLLDKYVIDKLKKLKETLDCVKIDYDEALK